MNRGERRANRTRLSGSGFADGHAGEEFDQRDRLAVVLPEGRALAVMDGARHRAAARREVIEQAEKEGQVVCIHPAFIHREDEERAIARPFGFNQPVTVRHAFGDALAKPARRHRICRVSRPSALRRYWCRPP